MQNLSLLTRQSGNQRHHTHTQSHKDLFSYQLSCTGNKMKGNNIKRQGGEKMKGWEYGKLQSQRN